MNRTRKIMRVLVAVLALVICMAPLSLARAEYSSWCNVNYDGEQVKVGIVAEEGIIPADAKFTVEWNVKGFFDFSIQAGGYPDSAEINLEKGRFVQLYVQIPQGVKPGKLQTQMICSQYDPEIVEIDGISYLIVWTDDLSARYIDSRIPDTGDGVNLPLWIGMLLVSAVGVLIFSRRTGRTHR